MLDSHSHPSHLFHLLLHLAKYQVMPTPPLENLCHEGLDVLDLALTVGAL
jgi:hypothetical protein